MIDTESNIFENCIQTECKEGPLITDDESGEITCGSCGIVLFEKTFTNKPATHDSIKNFIKNTQFGPKTKISLGDMGLFTQIDSKNKDAAGKYLAPDIGHAFFRLRQQDRRSKTTQTRNLSEAFVILDGICSRLSLPESVIEKAAYIYRKAKAHQLTRGRSRHALVSASVYAACRFTSTPRTLKDIADTANVRKKTLQKTYREISRSLDINFDSFDPLDFITRISSRINLNEKIQRDAIRFLKLAKKLELTAGKHPMGLAASVLYFSCVYNKKNVSQMQIAEASGTTTVTIRNDYQRLIKGFGFSPVDLYLQ